MLCRQIDVVNAALSQLLHKSWVTEKVILVDLSYSVGQGNTLI